MQSYGVNPFSPGVKSYEFVPDQLIAGQLQLVTDSVTVTGGAVYERGTVLGFITDKKLYTISKKTASDGSQNPVAILIDRVDTAGGDQTAGVYLMGEFNQTRLIFDASWTIDELKPALRPLSIFLRDSAQA